MDHNSTVSYNLGDRITFGSYPQTSSRSDRIPIKWRVLSNSEEDLLVVSECILDCKRYHREFVPVTWSDCDLRKWLNDEFFNTAFNDSEKQRIGTTLCTDNGGGSPDTRDKVFLLSVAQIKEFTDPGDGTVTQIRRRTKGTDFAKARKPDGCHLYVYDKGVEKDYIIEEGKKYGCSWWWTRTRLSTREDGEARVAFIGARSNIKSYGRVNLTGYGIRPALTLALN